jgi:hypothetical protein
MNLKPLIRWGIKTLALLDDPRPEVLEHRTRERLEEKVGWLRQFHKRLKDWPEIQRTIDLVLHFVRTQGLYQGAVGYLRKQLRKFRVGTGAAQVRGDLSELVAWQVGLVKARQRFPGTSEALKSAFGKFKTVKRDQARGGFTGLLLAVAACVAQ